MILVGFRRFLEVIRVSRHEKSSSPGPELPVEALLLSPDFCTLRDLAIFATKVGRKARPSCIVMVSRRRPNTNTQERTAAHTKAHAHVRKKTRGSPPFVLNVCVCVCVFFVWAVVCFCACRVYCVCIGCEYSVSDF